MDSSALNHFLADLESSDRQERWAALNSLAKLGPQAIDALPAVIRASRDSDAGVQEVALYALNQLQPDVAIRVPIFRQVLLDPNSEESVRDYAALSLGAIGLPSFESLLQALRSDDARIIASALRALGSVPTDAGLRTRVTAALVDVLRGGDVALFRRARNALRSIGSATVPALEVLLTDENPAVRIAAAHALLQIDHQHQRAKELLIDQLRQPAAELRIAAADALCLAQGDLADVQLALLELVDADEAPVSIAAAAALEELGWPDVSYAVLILARALERHRDWKASWYLTHGLLHYGPDARCALPALLGVLQRCLDAFDPDDEDVILCLPVTLVLGNVGAAASPALPLLEDLLHRAQAIDLEFLPQIAAAVASIRKGAHEFDHSG